MDNVDNDSHIVDSNVLIVYLKVQNVLQLLQNIFDFAITFDKINTIECNVFTAFLFHKTGTYVDCLIFIHELHFSSESEHF